MAVVAKEGRSQKSWGEGGGRCRKILTGTQREGNTGKKRKQPKNEEMGR